jgi:hypothetical protein
MTKIQLELSDDEDFKVELFKVKHRLKDKREAIKKMIDCFSIDFNIRIRSKENDKRKN